MSGSQESSKVALCSAIIAGVAYVGYSVVKQVLTNKGQNKANKGEL